MPKIHNEPITNLVKANSQTLLQARNMNLREITIKSLTQISPINDYTFLLSNTIIDLRMYKYSYDPEVTNTDLTTTTTTLIKFRSEYVIKAITNIELFTNTLSNKSLIDLGDRVTNTSITEVLYNFDYIEHLWCEKCVSSDVSNMYNVTETLSLLNSMLYNKNLTNDDKVEMALQAIQLLLVELHRIQVIVNG